MEASDAHLLQEGLPLLIPAFQLGKLGERVHVHILARERLTLLLDVEKLLKVVSVSAISPSRTPDNVWSRGGEVGRTG